MISVKEQDIKLINDILERNYYYYFKQGTMKNLSLLIYNDNNYNNSIFTSQIIDKKEDSQIVDNLEKILLWYIENNFKCNIYIEDNEWFMNNELREIIFNLILTYLKDKNIDIILSLDHRYCSDEYFIYLKQLDLLFQKNNLNLIIQFDIDILNLNDNNLQLLVNFGINYNVYIKNIITPENVQYQENFLLAIDKYNNNFYQKISYREQENEAWDEININQYIYFINFYIDFLLARVDENEFFNILLNQSSFISLKDIGIIDNTYCSGSCNLYKNLYIIVNNLTLPLCKKIQYEELIIGQFKIEDNKIKYCDPNNVSALILCTHLKRNMTPQCEYCSYIGFCTGFCHGEAYYKTLNPLIPIRETCLLRRSKYSYILYKLLQLNFDQKLLNIITNNYYKEYLIMLFEQIRSNII